MKAKTRRSSALREKKPSPGTEEIAKKYEQLRECCDVLSKVDTEEDPQIAIYGGFWRMSAVTIKNAGIDIEDIYAYIKELALKRKLEIESELLKK